MPAFPCLPNRQRPRNRLLAQLSQAELQHLLPDLHGVELREQAILYEIGGPIRNVYFPEHGLISVSILLQNGATAEAGMLGSSALVGVTLALGSSHAIHRARVEIPGFAWRVRTDRFLAAVESQKEFRSIVLQYARWRLYTLSQYIACNRIHLLPSRLARLLLTIHDEVGCGQFAMTHEFLSAMLGTARSEVAKVAARFRQERNIDYHHGHIVILNRKGLENTVCECYWVVKKEFEDIFPNTVTP